MKKETKELIEGLKDWYEKFRANVPLTDYTMWAVGDGEGYADEGASNMDKVIALLDSLEGLESQLTHGGFIPDRNGKPCKDGDRIEICLGGNKSGLIKQGILMWDETNFQFLAATLYNDEIGERLYLGGYGEVHWFEKEED